MNKIKKYGMMEGEEPSEPPILRVDTIEEYEILCLRLKVCKLLCNHGCCIPKAQTRVLIGFCVEYFNPAGFIGFLFNI